MAATGSFNLGNASVHIILINTIDFTVINPLQQHLVTKNLRGSHHGTLTDISTCLRLQLRYGKRSQTSHSALS